MWAVDIESAAFSEGHDSQLLTHRCLLDNEILLSAPRENDWGPGREHRIGLLRSAELPRDVPRQELNREQVIDPVQPTVALQLREIHVGHPRGAARSDPRRSLGRPERKPVIRGDRLREQLVALDLDAEFSLQPEHDVQEVDGFRPQIPLQGCGGDDVVFLDSQGFH